MSRVNGQLLARVFRQTHLLQAPYLAMFAADYVKNRGANRSFRAQHPEFAAPPEPMIYETFRTTDLHRYYEGGKRTARAIHELAATYLPPGPLRICEWGCGAARLLRHFPAIDAARYAEVYGTDYKRETIDWCRANIPGIHFELNSLNPPLPFADGYFDLLYSVSVYTHLPEDLQRNWVHENLRVLKPGGLLFLTVHGDAYRWRLLPDELAQYEQEGIVLRGGAGSGTPWYTSYNNPRFMPQRLLAGLDVVWNKLYPAGGDEIQDRWVIRKAQA